MRCGDFMRDLPVRQSRVQTTHELVLSSLLHSVFEHSEKNSGIVVGFIAANAGEGVSYVSRMVSKQLASSSPQDVLHTSSLELHERDWMPSAGSDPRLLPRNSDSYRGLSEEWRDRIAALRACYRFVIIDCSSLSQSSDALALVPHLDGMVVVVAANETRKAEIFNLLRQIGMVDGKVLGFVLNKRRYLIPQWLYRWLR